MMIGTIARSISLAMLCAALLVPLSANAQNRSERGVYDRLATVGITPEQVTDLRIYPRRDGNDRVQGSEAWVRVEQCPVGWVVITLGRTGQATYAYTRDGCEIPGLDSA